MTGVEGLRPMESPQYIRTSLAAAMILGLRPGRFYRDVECRCVNLLLEYDVRCRANCAYCGLARSRYDPMGDGSFIRVDWPVFSTEEILSRIIKYKERVRRICVSMVHHPRSYQDMVTVCRKILDSVDVPVSTLITATLLSENRIKEVKDLGVDMIGIGLDGASEGVFDHTRGKRVDGPHRWEQHWEIIAAARRHFGPFKVNCHLIVGIGERDDEMIGTFDRLRDMQVYPYLFSFYPEEGSTMARRKRPTLKRYRRLQLIRYLIANEKLEADQITYDQRGRIGRLALPPELLEEVVSSGLPFVTNGCPGKNEDLACTRPYANSRPGEPFRNFPFLPEIEDIALIRKQLRLHEICDGG